MIIDNELMLHLEDLAKLSLTDDEREDAKLNINKILDYMSKLNELDTGDVDILTAGADHVNRFREDVCWPSLDRELLLSNAALHNDECFKVPKTVE